MFVVWSLALALAYSDDVYIRRQQSLDCIAMLATNSKRDSTKPTIYSVLDKRAFI